MGSSDRYVMLLASLPHLGRPFGVDRPPINRLRLGQRLAWLEPADRSLVERIDYVVHGERLALEASDRDVQLRLERLWADLDGRPVLRRIVGDRLEMRTLIANLRRRRLGMPPPTGAIGWGRGVEAARVHWEAPAFRLEGALPWLGEAERLLRIGDAIGLERLLVGVAWKMLDDALGHEHRFDLEAVVAYVLRWGLVDRSAHQLPQPATERFDRLLSQALTGLRLEFGGEDSQ
ncbi:MAG: hypothetical protein IPM29_01715 [Planctomycetes bacterium]|nr:hypothetical protein [Planctomycetota bacterium]